ASVTLLAVIRPGASSTRGTRLSCLTRPPERRPPARRLWTSPNQKLRVGEVGDRPEQVQCAVGFYFTDQPPTNTPFRLYLAEWRLDIPAGANDYEIESGSW